MKSKKRDELLEILKTLLDEDLIWFEVRTPSVYVRLGTGPEVLTSPAPEATGDGQKPIDGRTVTPPTYNIAAYNEKIAELSAAETSAKQMPVRQSDAVDTVIKEHLVTAPFAGMFYRRPAPTEPPFVEVGTRVTAGDAVCLVEVMKLFNSVQAGVDGVVTAIEVGDGELVEYGQVLMRIAPADRAR